MKSLLIVTLIPISAILLSSCASTSEIERLESRISYQNRTINDLKRELSSKLDVEIKGVLENQEQMNNNLSSLQEETQQELTQQKQNLVQTEKSLESVRGKTDQFEVDHEGGAVFLVPSDLKDTIEIAEDSYPQTYPLVPRKSDKSQSIF